MTEKEALELQKITSLGQLKLSGYSCKSIKTELRDNLIHQLKLKQDLFQGIHGYEDTVIPDIQRALLARHNMIFLGLRGQAKTRMARSLVDLLDPVIPIVSGSDILDDPFAPMSSYAKELIAEKGDDTPIDWVVREDRYVEKLATPDVSVADLIGDVDPIKAANLKLDYSDERVIHYGLIPRSNRSIFVINELPDLQPRIQVGLFNMLQEGDIQIRGFRMRLPLDVAFVFTANPEDYTNRGSIITPLKDRIQSQILTHYAKSVELSQKITQQEAKILPVQKDLVSVAPLLQELLELVAIEARESELIDQKSGVSARLAITAYEHLIASVERRVLLSGEEHSSARVSDLLSIVPAITGKVELVYEGEQEGAKFVALSLIGKAIRKKFPQVFPDPEFVKRHKKEDPYASVIAWFTQNELDLLLNSTDGEFRQLMLQVDGLKEVVNHYAPGLNADDELLFMEFVLHALGEYNLLNKQVLETGISFGDLMNNLFSPDED